ncbi:MAG: hypothetical protein Q8K75_11455 [Chlamydiales bacterium]|nr:hypothetical protein [Chlamydiales bacterium]
MNISYRINERGTLDRIYPSSSQSPKGSPARQIFDSTVQTTEPSSKDDFSVTHYQDQNIIDFVNQMELPPFEFLQGSPKVKQIAQKPDAPPKSIPIPHPLSPIGKKKETKTSSPVLDPLSAPLSNTVARKADFKQLMALNRGEEIHALLTTRWGVAMREVRAILKTWSSTQDPELRRALTEYEDLDKPRSVMNRNRLAHFALVLKDHTLSRPQILDALVTQNNIKRRTVHRLMVNWKAQAEWKPHVNTLLKNYKSRSKR